MEHNHIDFTEPKTIVMSILANGFIWGIHLIAVPYLETITTPSLALMEWTKEVSWLAALAVSIVTLYKLLKRKKNGTNKQ